MVISRSVWPKYPSERKWLRPYFLYLYHHRSMSLASVLTRLKMVKKIFGQNFFDRHPQDANFLFWQLFCHVNYIFFKKIAFFSKKSRKRQFSEKKIFVQFLVIFLAISFWKKKLGKFSKKNLIFFFQNLRWPRGL